MTLWNPRTLFSRDPHSPEPSASFDPVRTGSFLPGSDVEVGYAGHGGSGTMPNRNPIGFAPPVDPNEATTGEPRFHTEISFKRYSSTVSPRASAEVGTGAGAGDEADVVGPAWVSPPAPADDRSGATDAGVELPASDVSESESEIEAEAELVANDGADEGGALMADEHVVAEKIPFYKREMTFRRRKVAEPEVTEPEITDAALEGTEIGGLDIPDAQTSDDFAAEPVAAAAVGDDSLVVQAVSDEPLDDESNPVDESNQGDTADDTMPALTAETDVQALDGIDDADPAAPGLVEHVPVSGGGDPAAHADEDWMDVAAESGADRSDEPDAAPPATEGKAGGEDPAPENPVGDKSTRRPFAGKRNDAKSTRTARKAGKGRKVVGLKIDASQIAAAVVVEGNGVNELIQLAQRPIDAGLVLDGEVRDVTALAHELKAFFDENSLPKKDVRIGLSSNRIGVRTFEIAGIDDEERFDNAVRFRAHEVLPVAQDESVLDYRILDERPTEDGGTSRRILLVVAPRDQVNPYVEVARAAGIKLDGLDLEALSLLRAFVDPKSFAARLADDTATVVVSIGHESTTLLVAGGGVCEFTRVFRWGAEMLQDAVTTELEVHPAEAATILRHLSLSGPGRKYDGLDESSRTRAVEAVRLRLTPFARELVSSLQFYQTQPDSLGIGEIVLTGGISHLEGLGEALNQMIGVAVGIGDPLARVTVSGEIDSAIEAMIGSMAVPIGLAIEDGKSRSVNLLPSEERSQARGRRPSLVKLAVPVAVAVPVVALGFMFVSAHGQVSSSQAELDALNSEIAALPRPQGAVIDAAVKGSQATRAQVVASLLGGRVAWDAVLRDVSRVLPENVWLNSFQAQVAPTSTTGGIPVAATAIPGVAAAPTGVQIDGYTYGQTDVARLLARLATLPSLSNVTLTASKVETKGAKSIVHFQIAADLNPGGSR